jgi:UDP-N-acetylmuramoyl-tripeptide--D-alanyl-D-alanine ligase
MADLLLRDVVLSTGGRLALAAMPPRDGDLTMLRRSTADAARVEPGDLYWALCRGAANGMNQVEEAFARGAAGAVISGRMIEPWPGRVALAVENVRTALWQAAGYARARFEGTVIALEGKQTAANAAWLRRLLTTENSGSSALCDRLPCTCDASDIAALGLMNAHPSHDFVVLEIAGATAQEITWAANRSCPHLAVITAAIEPESACRVLHSLPSEGWAIINGDDPQLRAAARKALPEGTGVLWIGREPHNDLVAERVSPTEHVLRFPAQELEIQATLDPNELDAALAALAAAVVLQISPLSLSAAFAKVEGDRSETSKGLAVGDEHAGARCHPPSWGQAILSR